MRTTSLLLRFHPLKRLLPVPSPFLHCFSTAAYTPPPSDAEADADAEAVRFLVDICHLPSSSALAAARSLPATFSSSSRSPSAVVDLLRSHGLSPSDVARVVSARPALLLCRPDSTLAPKLRFLSTLLPPSHLPRFLSLVPSILSRSLSNQIQPLFASLRCFLDGAAQPLEDSILLVARRHAQLFTTSVATSAAPNLALLTARGVHPDHVAKLLTVHPRSLSLPADRFARSFDAVEQLGIHPDTALFIHALRAVNGLRDESWERRLAFFRRRLGWSQEDFREAFQKAPLCILVSEEKLNRMVDFFLNEARLEMADIGRLPKLLMYGFEKRILPRFRVFQALESNGLLPVRYVTRKNKLLINMFTCDESSFLNKYVNKYINAQHALIDAYHGTAKIVKS